MNLDELRKLAGMPQTEWANSPATTAHPDPEEVQAPEADVNQSLRQYLNADPHPVKVVEGEEKVFEDHEVEDMMAKFKEYLNEDEAVEEQAQEEVVEQADETVEEGMSTPNSLEKVEAQIKKLEAMADEEEASDEEDDEDEDEDEEQKKPLIDEAATKNVDPINQSELEAVYKESSAETVQKEKDSASAAAEAEAEDTT